MSLNIREITDQDIASIRSIIAEAWNVREWIEDEEILNAAITMMFIAPVLNKSTFGKVATWNGDVVGVIFGSRVGETELCRLLQTDYTDEMLQLLRLQDAERNALVQLTLATNMAYRRLIQDREHEFQGCLEFFAVSAASRGKHIGKQLLGELKSYLRDTHATKLYVYTDTMSSYGFYDHNGFVRLDEEVTVFDLFGEELKNTNFIYEYVL